MANAERIFNEQDINDPLIPVYTQEVYISTKQQRPITLKIMPLSDIVHEVYKAIERTELKIFRLKSTDTNGELANLSLKVSSLIAFTKGKIKPLLLSRDEVGVTDCNIYIPGEDERDWWDYLMLESSQDIVDYGHENPEIITVLGLFYKYLSASSGYGSDPFLQNKREEIINLFKK